MKKILLVATLAFITAATAYAEKTISVMLNFDANTGNKWIKDMKSEYEHKYPERKVELDIIGGKEADYYTKASLMLRNSNKIDVVFEDTFMLKSDVSAGMLAPIPIENWSDWTQFYPSLREFVNIDGKIYGVPLSTDTRGLFYNTELFKEAGIDVPWQPKNWQVFKME